MAWLLRKTEKRRWDWEAADYPWLAAGRFPAAPIADLRTDVKCSLSVWHVQDDKSNLDLVIAGLAANLQNVDKFDYALFVPEIVVRLGIVTESSLGNSKDREANEVWHRDLIKLDSEKLLDLAKQIFREGEQYRRDEGFVRNLIVQSIKAERIDPGTMQQTLRQELKPFL